MDLLLTLANRSEMAPSGEIFADDEASTFKEMEALRIPGQWTNLEKMWSAQRHAGILLLASNSVRYQLLPFRAGKMPLAKPKLDFFFAPGTAVLYHTWGGYQL